MGAHLHGVPFHSVRTPELRLTRSQIGQWWRYCKLASSNFLAHGFETCQCRCQLDASRPYCPSYLFWWKHQFLHVKTRACHGTANTEIVPTALPPLVSCQVMFVTKNEITSFKIRPDWSVLAAGDCRRLLFPPSSSFRLLQLPYHTRFESGPAGLGAVAVRLCSRNIIAPQALHSFYHCAAVFCVVCTAAHRFRAENIGRAFFRTEPLRLG